MLKLVNLFENFPLAKQALENFDHDTDRLDEALSWLRISSNCVYPFFCNGKLQYLRLAPVDEKLEKNIRGEIEFLLYLDDKNFSAMKPLKAHNGEYLLTLDTQWGKYFACAFDGVSGEQIENTDFSEAVMLEYGRTLARLHSLAKEYEPTTKKWDYTEALLYIRSVFQTYNASEKMKCELENVEKELSQLEKTKDNFGLCHYDFELDNVFYDKETKSCNVIDFDDSMYHWYALDIEQVLDSIDEDCDGDKEKAKLMFMQGYRELAKFTEEDEKLLPLMRRYCNLNAYAQLIRSVADKLDNEPDWLLYLRDKFANKIQAIENTVN